MTLHQFATLGAATLDVAALDVTALDERENAVRKFIFSRTMFSALLGGVSVVQMTKKGPRDWRLALLWVSWAASVAIAVSTVVDKSHEASQSELTP